jgi:hypothetical protein
MHRILLILLLVLAFALPAAAQRPPQPRQLGRFQNWTAAVYVSEGQKTCYAFTRASRVEGVVNRRAKDVLLTVTHHPTVRDLVALKLGYPLRRNTEVKLVVGGQGELAFFAEGSDAFGRDGAGAVRAFRAGREALARAPGPNNRGQTNDVFQLAGFAQAYEAMTKECPVPRR